MFLAAQVLVGKQNNQATLAFSSGWARYISVLSRHLQWQPPRARPQTAFTPVLNSRIHSALPLALCGIKDMALHTKGTRAGNVPAPSTGLLLQGKLRVSNPALTLLLLVLAVTDVFRVEGGVVVA